ncbi:hypothetical protein H5410_054568 [Solanum commersonii]|uniref:Uncharacterized protein n=1 Tax=Solanum commersonii TaxID=4109 RepID=A0A9J5WFN3_SOLCO|nr:hypothetical protein H5410_054568 [Solanum commersonii]
MNRSPMLYLFSFFKRVEGWIHYPQRIALCFETILLGKPNENKKPCIVEKGRRVQHVMYELDVRHRLKH